MQGWHNRIVGHDIKAAHDFLANPHNWRVHPAFQQETLGAILDEIGWIQDVIVNRRTHPAWPEPERGCDTLIDGHLRVQLALQQDAQAPVPVKYVDLSPDEERLALASFDPVGTLAEADRERLEHLLRQTTTGHASLQAFLAEIANAEGLYQERVPTLDELTDTYGDPDLTTFWPKIVLQVPPEVHERYLTLMTDLPGETEVLRFTALLALAEQAVP
jgi:hypothetical protein